jgi:hypothetical protein
MSNISIILKQCPVETILNVEYNITDIESTHDTPGIYSVEIESIHCDGDILSLLAWYDYNSIIAEITDYINNLEDEK